MSTTFMVKSKIKNQLREYCPFTVSPGMFTIKTNVGHVSCQRWAQSIHFGAPVTMIVGYIWHELCPCCRMDKELDEHHKL